MGTRRKNLSGALVAVSIFIASAACMLYWSAGGPSDEVRDEAARMAATASEKVAPVITWKMRMLRYIGF
jgi:hypothetical protein